MVAGISGNSSPKTLEYVKNELTFIPTENGEITDDAKSSLSPDASNIINYFGTNKNILTGKIDDLIALYETKNKQASKEVSPNMDLSLNDSKIPKNI